MIKFSVSRLLREPVELRGFESAEWADIGDDGRYRVSDRISYDLTVTGVGGTQAVVSGSVRSAVDGVCGRCLADISARPVRADIKLVMDTAGWEEIDISEDIRAEFLLALPMNLLCRDDCRGLCPHCGADLNQGGCGCGCADTPPGDERWSALNDIEF